MEKQTLHTEMRKRLKDSAIQIVNESGMENLTIRRIADMAGLQESYVYRYYDGKEDILRKSFEKIQKTIEDTLLTDQMCLNWFRNRDRESCEAFLMECWSLMMKNTPEVLFFQKYRYSGGFLEEDQWRWKTMIETMAVKAADLQAQEDSADRQEKVEELKILFYGMTESFFSYVQLTAGGLLPQEEEVQKRIILQLLDMVPDYMKQEKVQ